MLWKLHLLISSYSRVRCIFALRLNLDDEVYPGRDYFPHLGLRVVSIWRVTMACSENYHSRIIEVVDAQTEIRRMTGMSRAVFDCNIRE